MEPVRPILLLTRPEAQSRRFLEAFRARFGADWPAVVSPLMEIEFLSPALPKDLPQDILFTSENGVTAFTRLCRDRSARAWCVGARTEAKARAAGFETRRGPGDAEGLAAALIADGGVRQVLYPRPVHAAADVAGALDSAGIEMIELTVYDQRALPPTAEAERLLERSVPILLPLFSPRSARLAARGFAAGVAPLWIAAISPATADAASALPAAGRATAAHPDAPAMLDALDILIPAAMTG